MIWELLGYGRDIAGLVVCCVCMMYVCSVVWRSGTGTDSWSGGNGTLAPISREEDPAQSESRLRVE